MYPICEDIIKRMEGVNDPEDWGPCSGCLFYKLLDNTILIKYIHPVQSDHTTHETRQRVVETLFYRVLERTSYRSRTPHYEHTRPCASSPRAVGARSAPRARTRRRARGRRRWRRWRRWRGGRRWFASRVASRVDRPERARGGCERCDARAKEAGRETRGGRTDGDDWTRARTREGVERAGRELGRARGRAWEISSVRGGRAEGEARREGGGGETRAGFERAARQRFERARGNGGVRVGMRG